MKVVCPQCGGRDIRYARLRSLSERFSSLVGRRPLRCRDCRARFTVTLWKPSDLRYARCPNCWNTKLTTWSPNEYYVPPGRGILLFLGAGPYRCDACRCNFVSFRPRKYRPKRMRRAEKGAIKEQEKASKE